MSNDHFVGIPSIHLLKTYENKKYPNIYAALEEYIDNCFDAFERVCLEDTKCPNPATITFSLDGDSIVIGDNASGMDQEQLKTALRLGDSGTDKIGLQDSLGMFGCGASSAALTVGESLEFLTKTKEGDLLYGALDPDYIQEHGTWAYPLRQGSDAEGAVFENILGSEAESGTVASVHGLAEAPKNRTNFYSTLKTKIKTRYSHKFMNLKQQDREVSFKFLKGDSRNFNATENIVDVLCDEDPSKTKFFKNFGGPNCDVSWINVFGCQVGVRASFTESYDAHLSNKREKGASENYWGYGINVNQKQGVYFYRNGKLLETRSGDPIWKYHGTLRGLLVEIHITEDLIEKGLVKIAQEKTSVILSEEFKKEMKRIFQPITTKVRGLRESESSQSVRLTDEQEKQKAAATVEGISRALKTQRKETKGLEPSPSLSEVIKQTSRKNKRYVGSGDKVEVSKSNKKQSDFDYKWVNQTRSKTTPFWIEYTNPEASVDKINTSKTIVLNQAHPMMGELKNANLTHTAIILAVAIAYGINKDNDFSTEEFEETAHGIGEIALKIMDSMKPAVKTEEKSFKVLANNA